MLKSKYCLIGLIGINNGMLPILVGSTLAICLKEQGINLATIGLLSLANLPFVLSFVIAASLDYLASLRYFNYKWLICLCLFLSSLALFYLPTVINQHSKLFITCSLISLAAATNRNIVLALQKTMFSDQELVIAVNVSTIAYKIGILLGGSLAIYLSQSHNWATLYHGYAGLTLGLTLLIAGFDHRLLNLYQQINRQGWWARLSAPFSELFRLPQIGLILLLMFFYRAPDNLITHYFDLFFLNYGISKSQVAIGYKFYGMLTATLGGIFCIYLVRKYNYIFNLKLALAFHCLSYVVLYSFTYLYTLPIWFFYTCVSLEEFSRGITMIIFWSFQTHLCKSQHVLVQLSLFTAIDSLSNSLFASSAGSIIQFYGYPTLIAIAILAFIPALIILHCFKD